MKKSKLKEIGILIAIVIALIVALLIFGFVSSHQEKQKSPDFQKFVLSTNFPINDYIYTEEKKPTDISKLFDKDEKQKEPKKQPNKPANQESNFADKAKALKDELINNKETYTKDIFPSNEQIQKEQQEKNRKSILHALVTKIPSITEEKNKFEKSSEKIEFGDSSFSNLKNKNSVSNETKLYRTITADKRIPVILTSSIVSTLSGQVVGVVEEDVYASMGTAKLIPKGSKAIGSYKNDTRLGDNRFALRWNRFITPHGIHIILDKASSADIKGNSGVLGVLDDRYWERYGLPLTLSTLSNSILLAISKQTASTNTNTNTNTQIILDNSRQDLSYIMKNIIDEQIKVKPIIKVKEASRVFIVSKFDIWFPEPKDGEIAVKYFNKKGEIK